MTISSQCSDARFDDNVGVSARVLDLAICSGKLLTDRTNHVQGTNQPLRLDRFYVGRVQIDGLIGDVLKINFGNRLIHRI